MRVLGVELRSLCFWSKHFTDWPISLARLVLLGRIRIPLCGGLVSFISFSFQGERKTSVSWYVSLVVGLGFVVWVFGFLLLVLNPGLDFAKQDLYHWAKSQPFKPLSFHLMKGDIFTFASHLKQWLYPPYSKPQSKTILNLLPLSTGFTSLWSLTFFHCFSFGWLPIGTPYFMRGKKKKKRTWSLYIVLIYPLSCSTVLECEHFPESQNILGM